MAVEDRRGYAADGRYLSDVLRPEERRDVANVDGLCKCDRLLVRLSLIRDRLVPRGQLYPGGAWPAWQRVEVAIDAEPAHVPQLRDPLRIVEAEPGALRM